jgi:cytochrome c oxidase assembly protein subunit 15
MREYIGMVSRPFRAAASDDGAYTIRGRPPGTYAAEAWTQKYGTQDQQVTVGGQRKRENCIFQLRGDRSHFMGTVGLRRFAAAAAVCTFLLVIAGGVVTSNDAALSIPDWPLAYGKVVPPLESGIQLEFVHRLLAALVALMTFALAVWSRRRTAWLAFAAVAAQALLGGAAVRSVDPQALAIAHACLAQLCFGLVVVQVMPPVEFRMALLAPAGALLVQTSLGAAVRHGAIGVIPHVAGAAVATLIVMYAGLSVLSRHMGDAPLRRAAMILLSLTLSQILLGMGAYMGRAVNASASQPLSFMTWFTVAHVAAGSLAFGAAIVLAGRMSGAGGHSDSALPQQGMVAA